MALSTKLGKELPDLGAGFLLIPDPSGAFSSAVSLRMLIPGHCGALQICWSQETLPGLAASWGTESASRGFAAPDGMRTVASYSWYPAPKVPCLAPGVTVSPCVLGMGLAG